LSHNTITAYIKDVKDFQNFLNENQTKISSEINYSFIRQWIVNLSENKYSKISINRKIASLKSYFNFLENIGKRQSSPPKAHKNLKGSSKIVIPFSEEEIKKLFDNFETSKINDRDKLIIEIFYSTGIRREELINIKIKHIFFDNAMMKIVGKRNKERLVPILPTLKENMAKYLEIRNEKIISSKNFFITSRGNQIGPSLVYRVVKKYFSKVSSKVKKSPHVLRHSFATHLLNNGDDINTIKEKTSALSAVMMKMGEMAYKANEEKSADSSDATDNPAENKEDVVDADFEEVKDNEEKKDAS
jgi:integrase/recombinase XerC